MNIERQIEFDKVKEIWAELAVTDWAKERIREATLFFSETELKKKLRGNTNTSHTESYGQVQIMEILWQSSHGQDCQHAVMKAIGLKKKEMYRV